MHDWERADQAVQRGRKTSRMCSTFPLAQDETLVFKRFQIPSFGIKSEPKIGLGAALGARF